MSKYSESDIMPYAVWKHLPTGTHYLVLGVGTCSTNGPCENLEHSVVYVSLTYQGLKYREVGEFLDGRFEPVLQGTVL